MIARSAEGSFRDALGTLEQLVTYGGKSVELDDVLDILGVADAELVLSTAEALAEHDPKAALVAVERLSAAGRDYTRFIQDLSGASAPPVRRPDARRGARVLRGDRRARRQACRAGRAAQPGRDRPHDRTARASRSVACADGSEARIELEVALLKAVQPQSDLSLQALMFRIEQLEQRVAGAPPRRRRH